MVIFLILLKMILLILMNSHQAKKVEVLVENQPLKKVEPKGGNLTEEQEQEEQEEQEEKELDVELAPLLESPLLIHCVGATKCRFPLSAMEVLVQPPRKGFPDGLVEWGGFEFQEDGSQKN